MPIAASASPRPASPATSARQAGPIAQELDEARRRGPLQQIVVPPCPELLQRLQAALAQRPDPDLSEVARIAGSDIAMSATLIRVANSPLYTAGQPVTTIGQAMNRLGLDQTAAVLTAFLARHAIRADAKSLARFWERSGQRAAAMAWIARRLPGLSPDLAHTCGLFSHVGLPVLLQSVRGYAGTLVEAAARIDRPFVATENANHRTDHAVVGALVARVWGLAPPVMAAIRLHHDPDVLADETTDAEVRTLVAALTLAEQLMRRHEGLPPDDGWQHGGAAALAWLGVDVAELVSWDDELRPVLEAF